MGKQTDFAWGPLYLCEGFSCSPKDPGKSRRAREKILAMPTQKPESEHPPCSVVPELFLEKALKNCKQTDKSQW